MLQPINLTQSQFTRPLSLCDVCVGSTFFCALILHHNHAGLHYASLAAASPDTPARRLMERWYPAMVRNFVKTGRPHPPGTRAFLQSFCEEFFFKFCRRFYFLFFLNLNNFFLNLQAFLHFVFFKFE